MTPPIGAFKAGILGAAGGDQGPPPYTNAKSLDLDGSNDYVSVADNDSIDLTAALTISAWIIPLRLDWWNGIVYKNTGSYTDSYHMGISGPHGGDAGKLTGGVKVGSSWYNVRSSSDLVATAWQHVVMTFSYSATTIKLYIDGVEEYSDTGYNHEITGNTGPLYIGRGAAVGEVFEGHMDEVGIWNVALSGDAIVDLAANGPAPTNLRENFGNYTSSGNLAGWWRMGDGTSDAMGDPTGTLTDMSDNTNTGTIYNMAGGSFSTVVPPSTS